MVEKTSYFELFMGEAGELLAGLNREAVELERDPGNRALIDSIFRAVHTLKGMAGIMEYRHLARFLHAFEAMLDGLRRGTLVFSADVAAMLFRGIDATASTVAAIGRQEPDRSPDDALEAAFAAAVPAASVPASPVRAPGESVAAPEPKPAYAGAERRTNLRLEDEDRERIFSEAARGLKPYEVVVRLVDDCQMPRARAAVVVGALAERGKVIREQYLDRQMTGRSFGQYFGLFYLSEMSAGEVRAIVEAVVEVAAADVRPMDLEQLPRSGRIAAKSAPAARPAESAGSTRVEISRLARLMDVTGEMLLARLRVEALAGGDDRRGFDDAVNRLALLMSELQHEVLKLQLVPIEVLFSAYPRLVRDTASKQGRRARLLLAGGEIGLDKRALDALNDPLLHLIRNAVGHGIELPEERKAAGKPEEGTVRIEARRERDRVIVTVADDGRGIDPAIAGEHRPPDGTPELFARLLDVICAPGFSTRRGADETAGRGVGMGVVRGGVEAIGGRLSLTTAPGAGTAFTLEVPLTLSIVQSLLFEIGRTPYAVPLAQVREIVRLPAGAIHRLERFEVFMLHGGVLPLVGYPFDPDALAGSALPAELPAGATRCAEATALVIETRGRPVALRVDALAGRQETIVKPLPALLAGVPGLTGTTILGNGRVAFVLDLAAALEASRG